MLFEFFAVIGVIPGLEFTFETERFGKRLALFDLLAGLIARAGGEIESKTR